MNSVPNRWPITEPIPRWSRTEWLVAGVALFILINGLSVCAGWWTRITLMVRLFPDDAPTHINTALCFILLSLGELALLLNRRGLVAAAAGATLLLVGTTAMESLLQADFGIDTLFALPFEGADALHPGRMSGNTIICFMLVAGAQLMMLPPQRTSGGVATLAIAMKSTAGGIAFIALLGYVVDLKSAYGWTQSVGMSVRSWAGFLLIFIAQMVACWKRDIVDQPKLPDWLLPFLAITVLCICTGLVWVFTSIDARPFSADPAYKVSARRIAIVVELCMFSLIALGTVGILVARRKSTMALRLAAELTAEMERRSEAEAALRSINQSLLDQEQVLDLAQVMVRDPQGRIQRWSQGAEKLYGYTREEALGRISHELLDTRFPQPLETIERQLEIDGVWEGELSHRTRGGDQIDVASIWALHRDGGGGVSCVLESNSDVTERNRVKQKLAAQLLRLDLLNAITGAIGERQDLASICQVVVRSLEDQLPVDFGCLCICEPSDALVVACVGVKSYELALGLGLTERAIVPIDQNGLSRCLAGELVYEPDVKSVPFLFPQRLAAAGLAAMVGAPLIVENKIFGVLLVARHTAHSFSSGECEFLGQLSQHVALAAHQTQLHGLLEHAYDDLRQTQQAVMRQEKLRVLGQMASGIAHDINNALSPAALYVESLLERASGQGGDKEYLLIVQRAIEGVAQTVARMKEFYAERDAQMDHVPVSLTRAAAQVMELTRARWSAMPQESGRVIGVQTDFPGDVPDVSANESEIRDALTNLILNAVDAMPNGGTLTLRVSAAGNEHVKIEVSDTGIGMDEATRSRCLELFFTTKGARGTGLGLAMVYGTVERHGGEIRIDSNPGAGTTVCLTFPNASGAAAISTVTQAPRTLQPLRILLVDDDPTILKSLLDTLEHDGHFVVSADGGQRGIDEFRLARAHGEPFSVVITDLGMPHIDGRAVAAAVKLTSPETPVVLLTGWGHRMLAESDTPAGVDRVLGKPPKLVQLRLALAELTESTVL